MTFLPFRKYFYGISGALVLASVAMLLVWGLNLGIDFTGGSLLELEFVEERLTQDQLQELLSKQGISSSLIQPTGEHGVIIRMRDLDEETHQRVLASIRAESPDVTEKRFVSIGPVIGSELQRKAIVALGLVVTMIVFYIAWAFRKVSQPVASWKYGVVAITALLHDILIPAGLFSYLGQTRGVEVDALFVTALLTVLGFSVHDTIVIFDRVRENLQRYANETFEVVVDRSIKESIIRSINTSLTLIFVLAALLLFGSESTRYFALALGVGAIAGTYSSLFLASPLLVTWEKWTKK